MIKIKCKHLHQHNSTDEERHNSVYVTVAWAIDEDGRRLGVAKARCRKGDNPSRKTGKSLAVGRLLSQLNTRKPVQVM